VVLGFVVHGIAALAIILVILGIFVLGVVSVFRMTGRGIRKARNQL
jgi:cbb3-type cytochrome oxidase subunit 3